MKQSLLVAVLLIAFTACSPNAEPSLVSVASPVEVDSPTVAAPLPTSAPATPTPVPTTVPAAAAEAVASEPASPAAVQPASTEVPDTVSAPVVVAGKTDDGAYFLGAVDAPVTLIDYSDFL